MDLLERPDRAFRRHPWETARLAFFTRALRDAGVFARPRSVLDVGAGDGWFLGELASELPRGSYAVAWDTGYGEDGTRAAQPAHDGLVEFTREEPQGRFDVLLMLDVLEHVEPDAPFLAARLERNLDADGVLLISVPAWPALYSSHDDALGHHRRYRPADLRRLLRAAGLEIVASGGLFHVLMLPRALSVLKERVWPPAEKKVRPLEWRGPGFLAGVVAHVLAVEGALSRATARAGRDIPGLTFWAVCRRAPAGTG